jgi:hypothetical protein
LLKLYVAGRPCWSWFHWWGGILFIPWFDGINKKNIIKENKEFASLLYHPDQTLDVLERINIFMSQLNTYKLITMI